MCPIDVSVRVLEEFDGLVSVPWLRQIAERALSVASAGNEAGLSVVIADDDLVRGLNKQYRGLDENTDVLAFSFAHAGEYYGEGEPQPGPGEESEFALPPGQESSLGEVIISYPQAQRQAAQSDPYRGEGAGRPADPRRPAPAGPRPREAGGGGGDGACRVTRAR